MSDRDLRASENEIRAFTSLTAIDAMAAALRESVALAFAESRCYPDADVSHLRPRGGFSSLTRHAESQFKVPDVAKTLAAPELLQLYLAPAARDLVRQIDRAFYDELREAREIVAPTALDGAQVASRHLRERFAAIFTTRSFALATANRERASLYADQREAGIRTETETESFRRPAARVEQIPIVRDDAPFDVAVGARPVQFAFGREPIGPRDRHAARAECDVFGVAVFVEPEGNFAARVRLAAKFEARFLNRAIRLTPWE